MANLNRPRLQRETEPPRETFSWGAILGRGIVVILTVISSITMLGAGEVGLAIVLLGIVTAFIAVEIL